MNAIKMKVLAVLSILAFMFAIPAQAEIVTIWGEGKHVIGDNDTKDDARKLAMLRAKTMCLEKAGTYLERETIVKDLQLAKHEIKAYTAGIVRIRVVDEQGFLIGESPCVTVKVKADIDTSRLDERIKQLRKHEKILADYKKMQVDIERLTKQVAELQKQLEQAKDKEQIDKIKVARKDALDELGAIFLADMVLDEATSSHPNYDLVVEWNKKAIEIKPDYAWAHCTLGFVYAKKGLYDKGIVSLKKAIEIKPDYAWAHCTLGFVYAKKGLYDKGIVSLKKAIELEPDYAGAWYNRACIYSLKEDKENALKNLSKAIELDPKLKESAKKDEDFKKLWDDEDFKKILSWESFTEIPLDSQP